jgi:hypothetical protein
LKEKSVSLKKLNMIDKPLSTITKMRMEKIQISKIRNEKGGDNNKHTDNQGIIKDCFENL